MKTTVAFQILEHTSRYHGGFKQHQLHIHTHTHTHIFYFKFIALNYNQPKNIIQFKFLFPRLSSACFPFCFSFAPFFSFYVVFGTRKGSNLKTAPFYLQCLQCELRYCRYESISSLFFQLLLYALCLSSTKSIFTNKKFRFIFCVTESRISTIYSHSFHHISFA